MSKKITNRLRNREGFTLIELLLVFAVLGIIAAIAIPQFLGVTDYSREKADKSAAEMAIRNVQVRVLIEEVALPAIGKVSEVEEGAYGEALPQAQSQDATMKIYLSTDSEGVTTCVVTDSTVLDDAKVKVAEVDTNGVLAKDTVASQQK